MTILDDIAKARCQIEKDGVQPHTVKMHPETLREFMEDNKAIMALCPYGAPSTVFGLVLKSDPVIPMGKVVAFDADGDPLMTDRNGKYVKAVDLDL